MKILKAAIIFMCPCLIMANTIINDDFNNRKNWKPLNGTTPKGIAKQYWEVSQKKDAGSIGSVFGVAYSGYGYDSTAIFPLTPPKEGKVVIEAEFTPAMPGSNGWMGLGFVTSKKQQLYSPGAFGIYIRRNKDGDFFWRMLIDGTEVSVKNEDEGFLTEKVKNLLYLEWDIAAQTLTVKINRKNVANKIRLKKPDGTFFKPNKIIGAGFQFTHVSGLKSYVDNFKISFIK